jgi:hypothetical protein
MQRFRQSLFWFILGFLPFRVSASLVVPNDGPYQRLRRQHTEYIYEQSTRDFLDQVVAYNEAVLKMYELSFGWRLDERLDLVLTSPNQQIANAFATLWPNLKTVWYPSGAGMLEEMAESSWLLALSTHESAHLYQLNAKRGWNENLAKVFRNAFVISPFIWPVFIHPNAFTPTFMLEGNAVFNESRLNLGGRLHSGEARALVTAQIAAGDIDPARLINDDFRFPFLQEAYLQGGYFNAFLAQKYGVDKTNQFFVSQGSHYLWPLILNQTFRAHFGESYPQLIREYVRWMNGFARNQQQTPGDALIDTTFISPLNHDNGRIFFLATSGKEPPRLYVFDKSRRQFVSSERRDLIMGKVFFEDQTPMVAKSDQHNLHKKEYSLYREGAELDPRFKGQIVGDWRAGKTVALDARNSWLDPRLLVNGEPYDIAHSNPILDDRGNVYYFRQNGHERILYRNREPVFRFEGFYAKLTEVGADGTIYFIANTDYGSTLYRYQGHEISRLLASDRVIDARRIREGEFLVKEVNAKGHRVILAKTSAKAQSPANYSYGFPLRNLRPEAPKDQLRAEERPYHGLREMRFSALDAFATYGNHAGLGGILTASFNDPLLYNALSLGYSGTQHRDQAAVVQYAYTRYLLDVVLRYSYKQDWWEQRNGQDRTAHDQSFLLGFQLPLLRHKRWDAEFMLAGLYDIDDSRRDPSSWISEYVDHPRQETYGTFTRFNLSHQIPSMIGFFPWRSFNLAFTNRLESEPGNFVRKYNTSLLQTDYTHGFPLEFFALGTAGVAWAENRDIDVEYSTYSLTDDIRVPRLTTDRDFEAKTASFARLEIHKVFDLPFYSERLPVGLNRVSPFAIGQGIALDRSSVSYPANIFEWGYGADIELLLIHKAPVRFRFLTAVDTRNPDRKEQQMTMSFRKEF